ncbi:MAG: MBL fold metallo-hydrolase, partial [Sphingomonas sp.]
LETRTVLERRFDYVFHGKDGYPPIVRLETIADEQIIGDILVRFVPQPHGGVVSTGLRFEADGFAVGYATDFNEMTMDMRTLYETLDLWIVDALRRRPHPSHPDLAMAIGWISELRPKRAVLMHMDQSMDYATLASELPHGVEPGYDGWEFVS